MKNVLHSALKTQCTVDWEKLKRHEPFSKPEPTPPVYLEYPREPQSDDLKFKPVFNLFDKLSKKRREQKTQAAQELYLADHAAWAELVESTRIENERRYAQNVADVEQWNRERKHIKKNLRKEDAAIDERRAKYEALQKDGIEDYCEMVLANSEYPDGFPQSFDLEYNPETKILIVEYSFRHQHICRD